MAGKYKNEKYRDEYNSAHYDSIMVRYKHELRYKEQIRALADSEGMSVSAWVVRAIDRELAREAGDYREE